MADVHDSLLTQAIAGDREALVQVLAKHGPEVRRRLEGAIGGRWRSILSLDDVMQEAYTDAFLSIGVFVPRGSDSFTGWLLALARRNIIDAIRILEAEKRGGNRRQVIAGDSENSSAALYERLCVTSSTPSRRAATRESCASLNQAIAGLPETYRRVVEMYDLDGRSVEHVAAELGRSVGAVYMLRARAHRSLASLLGGAA
jgi:RNA polymerase sigma-70 factor, ECF subfamily